MDFIELKTGLSVEAEKIDAFRIEKKFSRYIYLIAGVHGDEVEGVYVLNRLFSWLRENEDIEIPLIVLPVLNVDGYRTSSRVNSNGVDLNRNLPSTSWNEVHEEKKYFPGKEALSEPESKYFVKILDKFEPGLIISLHSWKPILNYNGDCQELAGYIGEFNKYPVEGDIGYPTPGSLGDFAPEKYNCPVITYELPRISDDKSLKDIWEENTVALKKIFESEVLHGFLN
ncbi:MAG: DUF2817 domain-containing protein [Bacteriovoracaceae bacterium]|nr:DUF2817 domain-containing protein [Bacteriovoracaceae bacterium]